MNEANDIATVKGTECGKECNGRNRSDADKRTMAAAWFTTSGLEFTDVNRRAFVKAFLAAL